MSRLCCMQHDAVQQMTANSTAHGRQNTAISLERLFRWIEKEVEQNKITFIVKSSIAKGAGKEGPVDGNSWADANNPAVALS